MLDKNILEKAGLISYSPDERSNIAASSNHLRGIIQNQTDFNESFLGGSYKRSTMVKGISDVDIYYQYTEPGNSQTALARLKACLVKSYPNSIIKHDKPSILVDFDRIPFNITPYKAGVSGNISIPDNSLSGWKSVNFGKLESDITKLRQKNPKYIDLIKILKLWNKNYNKGLQNFHIEQRVCSLFLKPHSGNGISDWLRLFFQNNDFTTDAQKIQNLVSSNSNEVSLRTEWLKFIDRK